jgi:hypothetical protein
MNQTIITKITKYISYIQNPHITEERLAELSRKIRTIKKTLRGIEDYDTLIICFEISLEMCYQNMDFRNVVDELLRKVTFGIIEPKQALNDLKQTYELLNESAKERLEKFYRKTEIHIKINAEEFKKQNILIEKCEKYFKKAKSGNCEKEYAKTKCKKLKNMYQCLTENSKMIYAPAYNTVALALKKIFN